MRNPRIYLDMDLTQEGLVALPQESLHYLTRVLRLPDGAACRVFDGLGLERHAQLVVGGRRTAALKLGSIAARPTTPKQSIRLLQAIIKTDAMDYAMQKAVELGVSILQPVLTERSLSAQGHRNLERRHEHWLGVIRSACEQCGRNELPELHPPQDLHPAMKQLPDGDCRVVASADGLHWREWISILGKTTDRIKIETTANPQVQDTGDRSGLVTRTDLCATVSLLIGPEGGLTTAESLLAKEFGFQPLALGPRVLRAETATVVALTMLQWLCGGWDHQS